MPLPLLIGLAAKFILPSLASKLTGKIAEKWGDDVGNIAKQITGALTPEEAAEKIQADPNLQAQFAAQISAAGFKFEEALLADKQNARWRDVELARLGRVNYRADGLAIATFVQLIGVAVALVTWGKDMNETVLGAILLWQGMLIKSYSTMVDFEFGSSASSKAKTEMLNNKELQNG